MSESRSIFSTTRLIALCTLASRVTGLLRDMLMAYAFGAAWLQDVFSYAFQIPNLFRRLLGEGAMAAAFVPVFSRVLEVEGRERAWAVLARVLALLTLTLLLVVGAIEAIIGVFAWLNAADGMILTLTAITTPFLLTVCIVALLSSILNCVGSFVPAALVSIVLNAAMIVAIVWLGPLLAGPDLRGQMHIVAWSVPLAGFLQILCLLPALRAHHVALGWRLDLADGEVRAMVARLAPVALGQGTILISTYLDTQICIALTGLRSGVTTGEFLGLSFAYPLAEGAQTCVTVAQRLYQFPMGVLVISMATAALPVFSRLAAREQWDEWGQQLRGLLRMAAFEGVLVGAAMIVLAIPITRLLFEYGRFDADATARAARVLACYGFGMWAFAAQAIIQRGFYSVGDVRTPLWIALVATPVNVGLSFLLVWRPEIRESAFAISSVLTATAAFLVGAWFMGRRRPAATVDRPAALAFALMVVAAAAAAGITWFVLAAAQKWISACPVGTVGRRALETLGGLGLLTALYLGMTRWMGLPEALAVTERWLKTGRTVK